MSLVTTSMTLGPSSRLTLVVKLPSSFTEIKTPLTLRTAVGRVFPLTSITLVVTTLSSLGDVISRKSGMGVGLAVGVGVGVTVAVAADVGVGVDVAPGVSFELEPEHAASVTTSNMPKQSKHIALAVP